MTAPIFHARAKIIPAEGRRTTRKHQLFSKRHHIKRALKMLLEALRGEDKGGVRGSFRCGSEEGPFSAAGSSRKAMSESLCRLVFRTIFLTERLSWLCSKDRGLPTQVT